VIDWAYAARQRSDFHRIEEVDDNDTGLALIEHGGSLTVKVQSFSSGVNLRRRNYIDASVELQDEKF
jgi:hypothetical protein